MLTPFNTNMVLRYFTSTFFNSSMEDDLLTPHLPFSPKPACRQAGEKVENNGIVISPLRNGG
jgi:hypothetical protein